MASLTKTDLIAELADRTKSTKASTDRAITALQEIIMEAVSEGKEVRLTGFASFIPETRPAREMKNPKTGDPVEVPETKIVKIKPLGVFKEKVKNS